MSWLPVTDRARSTIIARRALKDENSLAVSNFEGRAHRVPLRGLAHPLNDSVQSILATLLESLGDRLDTLLVGGILEQTTQKVLNCHLPMAYGPVFENWVAAQNVLDTEWT